MSAGAATPETKNSASQGIAWLLTDMALVTFMSALVKANSVAYPAIQLVFIRALIGLLFILPMIIRNRAELTNMRYPLRNAFRVTCNAIALTSNFLAFAMLRLVMVNALGFTRPLVTMGLAALLLGERVSRLRWLGAALAFGGALIIVSPDEIALNPGIFVVIASIVFGATATIQTRRLKDESTIVMMVFYTVGLALLTGIPAVILWQPVPLSHWPVLALIGLLAQAGQYCWLRAYQKSDASVLAPFGYLSVFFAAAAGFFFFGEIPPPRIFIGVAVILVALQGTRWIEGRRRI
ncbi:DMT family transporter [Martelella endophytica]|uniref:Multidrug transporter n=1 Tax=Martelella endophytica TaxID=1486262 RepID=A0A0D5LT36_MAREN|nr:DMT family transporter [Martelella endophytica]AJY47135.1 multidrug transporter [Martelella endophytica]